jgi:hypothetical protein
MICFQLQAYQFWICTVCTVCTVLFVLFVLCDLPEYGWACWPGGEVLDVVLEESGSPESMDLLLRGVWIS